MWADHTKWQLTCRSRPCPQQVQMALRHERRTLEGSHNRSPPSVGGERGASRGRGASTAAPQSAEVQGHWGESGSESREEPEPLDHSGCPLPHAHLDGGHTHKPQPHTGPAWTLRPGSQEDGHEEKLRLDPAVARWELKATRQPLRNGGRGGVPCWPPEAKEEHEKQAAWRCTPSPRRRRCAAGTDPRTHLCGPVISVRSPWSAGSRCIPGCPRNQTRSTRNRKTSKKNPGQSWLMRRSPSPRTSTPAPGRHSPSRLCPRCPCPHRNARPRSAVRALRDLKRFLESPLSQGQPTRVPSHLGERMSGARAGQQSPQRQRCAPHPEPSASTRERPSVPVTGTSFCGHRGTPAGTQASL